MGSTLKVAGIVAAVLATASLVVHPTVLQVLPACPRRRRVAQARSRKWQGSLASSRPPLEASPFYDETLDYSIEIFVQVLQVARVRIHFRG